MVHENRTVIANYEPSAVVHPGKAAFCFPSLSIVGIDSNGPSPTRFALQDSDVSGNRAGDTSLSQMSSESSTVISFIGN